MKVSTVVVGAVAVAVPTVAQRPNSTSICDYYTTALFKNNTAANQLALVTKVVNTAVIGNYSATTVGGAVPGILANGTVNGTAVSLAPYFTGALASSNRNNVATAVNFLDGGGADPLKKDMAANSTNTNQYRLLTHLYQYFGALLGCSAMDYPAYMGQPSMGNVHKFMDLSNAQNTYFIQQVGASAASFGVASADITIVANALINTFNYRCSPPVTVIKSQGNQTQAICQQEATCPLATGAVCDQYQGSGVPPKAANATSSGNTTSSGSPSATSSRAGTATSGSATSGSASGSASPSHTGAANKATYGLGAGLLAIAALAL